MPPDFVIETTRGTRVESVHRVRCIVMDANGRVCVGGPDTRAVWWRSSAKPFQAMPLLEDGVTAALGLEDEELAIACASHSSEVRHREVVARFMAKVGIRESDLACGPHPPLSTTVFHEAIRSGAELTPIWSNCSGKHTGLLALARHHGWPLAGYGEESHPVQQRLLASIEAWTGVSRSRIERSVDGCATVCYGVPLAAMARAWARFAVAREDAPSRLRRAMLGHPWLLAGTGRPCTALMEAWPGELIAKVGAEGVYGAALPTLGLGLALKVEDGGRLASVVALAHLLVSLAMHFGTGLPSGVEERIQRWLQPEVRNTRGTVVGVTRACGDVVFTA